MTVIVSTIFEEKKRSKKNKATDSNRMKEIVDMFSTMVKEQIGDNNFDLDKIEAAETGLLNLLRKKSTEKILKERDVSRIDCPECGAKMFNKELAGKTVQGLVCYEFLRRSFHCKGCGKNIKPLDSIIGCEDGYTLEAKEAIVLIGQRIPFEESSFYLDKLLKIKISSETIRKFTEGVGQQIAKNEQHRVNETVDEHGFIKQTHFKPAQTKKSRGTAYLLMDGAMVQTKEEGWKEIRNGLIYSNQNKVQVDKYHKNILRKKYFSEFNSDSNSLKRFLNKVTQQANDFNFHNYEQQVIAGDGAPYIWNYAEIYHPDAIQILDYYHASEYLGEALKTIVCKDENKKELFDFLWDGNIEKIINWLEKQEKTDKVIDCLRYYTNNKDRMRYKEYRNAGLDIGSGAIESAHRIIVHTRMKQSGMYWGKANVQSMASLRAMYLSGEWNSIVNSYLKKAA